jgi:hypothetical protein
LEIWTTRLVEASNFCTSNRANGSHYKKRLKRATDIKPADVTVTPDGVAAVPTTDEDGTGVFLGLRHRDSSKDDATDNEQEKE